MRDFKYLFVMILAVALMIISGCSKPAQKPQQQQQQPVGVSLPDLNSDSGKALKKAFDQNKEKQVKIIFKDARNDAAQQELQVQELLEQKVKVIVIEFIEPLQAMRLVEQIKGQGIKILAINNLPPNVPLEGYIGPDFTRVGQLQGQFILNRKKELSKPEVMALLEKDKPTALAVIDGESGILSGQVKVEAKEITTTSPTVTKSEVQKAITTGKNPGAITTSAPDLTKAFLESAVDPTLVTVGTGITKESAQAIMMGLHDADVDLMPDLVGTYAVKAAKELVKNGFWQSDTVINNENYDIPATFVPVRLITKDNLFLVKKRLGKIAAKPPQQAQSQGQQGGQQSGSGGSQGSGGQSQGQSEGGGKQGTKLIIETTDGKKMELQIDGEIKSVQVQKGGQKQEGQQGGGQQGGQQGGKQQQIGM